MNYRASRIREVWPSRPEAVKFAGDPEGLANSVYANRMGNGPPSSGDGWRYRGRGLLQTTGRYSYAKYGKRCGVDFEGNPDLVLAAEHALKPALAEWVDGKCNEMADADNIVGITKRINGGQIGLADRRAWLAKIKPVVASAKPASDPAPVPTDKQDMKTAATIGSLIMGLLAAAIAYLQHDFPWGAVLIGIALLAAAGVAGYFYITKWRNKK